MKIVEPLANFHGWLCDKDFLWWPFSFLRPPKNQRMEIKDVLAMTGCFGGLTFVFFIAFALVNGLLTGSYFMAAFLSCFVGFFLWFLLITKPLWNYRVCLLSCPR